jgi:hypothetical protein
VACALSYSPSCTHIGSLLSPSVAGSKPVSAGSQSGYTLRAAKGIRRAVLSLGFASAPPGPSARGDEGSGGVGSVSRSGSVRRGLSHKSFSVLSHSAVRGLPLYAGSYPHLLVQFRVS